LPWLSRPDRYNSLLKTVLFDQTKCATAPESAASSKAVRCVHLIAPPRTRRTAPAAEPTPSGWPSPPSPRFEDRGSRLEHRASRIAVSSGEIVFDYASSTHHLRPGSEVNRSPT